MMNEFIKTVKKWIEKGESLTMARVTKTWGSSPRPAGSIMFFTSNGEMTGSVSGGCVEGDVLKTSQKLFDNADYSLQHYGVSDEEAWTAGLTCGGQIDILLQRVVVDSDWWNELSDQIEKNEPCILITTWQTGVCENMLIKPDGRSSRVNPAYELKRKALQLFDIGTLIEQGEDYFIQVFPGREKLFLIGAAHITVDLVFLAKYFGFETIVIDPRQAFADKTHFDTVPDRIISRYPSEVLTDYEMNAWSFAVILSHDPKIDDNALEYLLRTPVRYIGALGGKKSHGNRLDRLHAKGFSREETDRIHGPVGVDIHAKTAREIALSIMAEIIRIRNGSKG